MFFLIYFIFFGEVNFMNFMILILNVWVFFLDIELCFLKISRLIWELRIL